MFITTRPDFQGIETIVFGSFSLLRKITTRPDFQGIETGRLFLVAASLITTRPDFQGIETLIITPLRCPMIYYNETRFSGD